LRETLVKLVRKVGWQKEPTPVLHSAMSRQEKESERILAILFKYSANLSYTIENLTPEVLIGEKTSRLYTDLVIYYNKVKDSVDFNDSSWLAEFSLNLDKELVDYLNQLTLFIDREAEELTADKVKDEVIKIIRDLKRDYINSQLKKLGEEIKRAEAGGDLTEVKKLSEKFSELTGQLYNLS
jgi:hypothetical protein